MEPHLLLRCLSVNHATGKADCREVRVAAPAASAHWHHQSVHLATNVRAALDAVTAYSAASPGKALSMPLQRHLTAVAATCCLCGSSSSACKIDDVDGKAEVVCQHEPYCKQAPRYTNKSVFSAVPFRCAVAGCRAWMWDNAAPLHCILRHNLTPATLPAGVVVPDAALVARLQRVDTGKGAPPSRKRASRGSGAAPPPASRGGGGGAALPPLPVRSAAADPSAAGRQSAASAAAGAGASAGGAASAGASASKRLATRAADEAAAASGAAAAAGDGDDDDAASHASSDGEEGGDVGDAEAAASSSATGPPSAKRSRPPPPPPETFALGDSVNTKNNLTGKITSIVLGESLDAPAHNVGITHYVVEFVDHGRASGRRWSETMLPEQLSLAPGAGRRRRAAAPVDY